MNRASELRRKRDSKGLCVECGRGRDTKGKTCRNCLSRKHKAVAARRKRKQENGLCWVCKSGIALNGGQQCEICMLKSRCVQRIGSRKFWIEAKAKWDQQQGICPYTGRKMTLVESEIDHIIPTSRGGTHDLSNIEFVPAIINRMKSDQTVDEFLKLVEEIYHYRIARKRCGNS